MNAMLDAIGSVEGLTVDFWDDKAWVNVVNQVFFCIYPGETLGLAGESGCGKTTTAYAVLGYRRPGSRFREGKVLFEGRDLLSLKERELQPIRGAKISLVPQNPATALTPSMRVGRQMIETLEAHAACSGHSEAEERTLDLFTEVGLPRPRAILERYPHQLSGGQQQRVILAIALACNPTLLVLDEPTTGLDVTTQARILRLLTRLQAQHGMAMLYVSHNLGVLAQICNRLAIMYAGELVEVAPTVELFRDPRHPYTRGLIAAVPRVGARTEPKVLLRGLLRRDELPPGCRFAPRCDYAEPECSSLQQSLANIASDHQVGCWLWEKVAADEFVLGEEYKQHLSPTSR
jgi:peptide/nickel transport system ATP-binding protein